MFPNVSDRPLSPLYTELMTVDALGAIARINRVTCAGPGLHESPTVLLL